MVDKPDCDEEETVCKAEKQQRMGTDPGGRALESVLGHPPLALQSRTNPCPLSASVFSSRI